LGAGVKNVAHGIVIGTTWQFVSIFGAATDTVGFNYYPLPFTTTISVAVNNTNIVINNTSGIVFNKSLIILEYTKN
jgi:hypothetical protein